MTGHIIFLSCLLAICLPIICVQVPRFDFMKNLHAETEPETRSTLLRRRSLSLQEALRRNPRFLSELDIDDTSAESKQRERCSEQERVVQDTRQRRWHTGLSRPIFQGDASADHRASSREEDKAKESRVSKNLRQSLRQQHRVVVPGRRRPVDQGSMGTSSSPPPRTGRDLEAQGPGTMLFSPGRVPGLNLASGYEHDSEHPTAQGSTSPRAESMSLPSPFDGSPMASRCHTPQDLPTAGSKRHSCCHHRHCRHVPSDATLRQPSNCPTATPKETQWAGSTDVAKPIPKDIAEKVNEHAQTEHSKAVDIKRKSSLIPWKALSISTSLMIFIFAFAILIAHCLAWFLVYKTEARLGEVRSGLLRGGEMKLCLCGKG